MSNEKCNDIASDNCATQTFLPSIDSFIPEPCSQLSTSVMNENAAFHSLVEREWLPKPLYYEVVALVVLSKVGFVCVSERSS